MIAEDIAGDRIILTALDESFVTDRYLRWMNDPEVTRYLESRFSAQTLEGLASFVDRMRASPDNYFFAIVERATGEHWGNIKLGSLNGHHQSASVGIVIGEPSAWGKGVATEAISLVTDWAFGTLGLVKLTAGSYGVNVGSIRAFEKAGWIVEGRQAGQVMLEDGSRDDAVMLGRLAEGTA